MLTTGDAGQVTRVLRAPDWVPLVSTYRPVIATFVVPLCLYLLTLAPTIYNLDSAELTVAAATGGLTRATGYPFYLAIGHLWSLLPIGDVGYRLNLLSAVAGALTIFLAARILQRCQVGPWATLGALGLLATAPYFWALSVIAEVYTVQTALTAALILALLRWAERRTARRLMLVGLVLGLGLAHHGATLLLLPGVVWYAAAATRREPLPARALLPLAAGLAAGLSFYLYLPLRFLALPAFNYAGHYDPAGVFQPVNLLSLDGLWWLVSGRVFAGEMLGYGLPTFGQQLLQLGVDLWRAFFVVGVGPGLLGLVLLIRRDRGLGGMLLLTLLANAAFFADYRVADKQTMYLPIYLVWALWAGIGYQWLLGWLHLGGARPAHPWQIWALRGAIVAVVFAAAASNWRLADRSGDWTARARGEAVMREVEPGALLFGWWETVPVVQYLQLVEGQRPDVQAISRFLIGYPDLRELIVREAARRPTYVDSVPADLLNVVDAVPAGPIYRLLPRAGQGAAANATDLPLRLP